MKPFFFVVFILLTASATAQFSPDESPEEEPEVTNTQKRGETFIPEPEMLFSDLQVSDSDSNYDDDYFGYAGITLGTPGLVNINFGGYSTVLGGQLSISGLNVVKWMIEGDDEDQEDTDQISDDDDDEDSGVYFAGQLNVSARIVQSQDYLLSATVALGVIALGEESYVYWGPGLHFFYKHFFAEAGWAWAAGIKDNADGREQFPFVQLGFVGSF